MEQRILNYPHWQPPTLDVLVQLLQAKERGDPVDKTTFDTQVAKAVEMVVRQQKNSSRVSNLCQSGMGPRRCYKQWRVYAWQPVRVRSAIREALRYNETLSIVQPTS